MEQLQSLPMKGIAIALLCLAMPVSARTPHPAAKATPAPATAQPLAAPAVPMARQRTAQEDAELKDWIEGIMVKSQDAEKHADQAEQEAKSSRDQGAIAVSRLMQADAQLSAVQKAYDEQADALAKAVAQLAVEHKAREAAEHHLSRLKTYLGFALGLLLLAAVQYIPFGIFPPPMSIYGRVGASVLAFGLGWFIVARVV